MSGENITLRMLDFWQGAEGEWADAVIAAFEAEHPNITVERTTQDWNQVISTLNLRLADSDGPDIALVNNGWQSMGTLAEAGRILDLDDYAELYGWESDFPSTILRQEQFTPDGSEMGTGSIYATPAARSSLIGLYYNTEILDQLGIPVPTTLAEFEEACAEIAADGQVPIAYGSLDKGPATAILLAVQNLFGSAEDIGDFVYSTGTPPITSTGLTEAATTVREWADAGWFTPNHEGVQHQDAIDHFLSGEGAFRFEYTGSLGFSTEQRQTYGYTQLPQVDGGQIVGTGSTAGNLAISARSDHPDAAAAFLDFMASEAAAQISVDHGYLPLLHTDLDAPDDNPEFRTEVEAQQRLEADNGYVPYFDWATPTMLDTLGGETQRLLAGQITPEQLTDAGQDDYDAFQGQRGEG
ncbi:ABC transporter substrate-binding protein [Streptomyces mayteni]